MSPRFTLRIQLLFLLGLSFSATAETVSVNFVGSAGANGSLAPGDEAGASPATHWNNVTVSGAALVDATGAATGITVTFGAGGWMNTLNTGDSPNQRLMRGYLDIGGQAVTTVTLNGLDAAKTYRIFLYADGENTFDAEPVSRTGTYTVGGTATGITDTAGEQFEGTFQSVFPGTTGEGNYTSAVVSGAASYAISIRGTAADGIDGVYRSPLNALQVVEVTE